ncbi:MAG TPA: hypothetical protein VNE71_16575, partial [Myxococcota bacterium]|nr:hypothetical protein [Myxococcota bacterium]
MAAPIRPEERRPNPVLAAALRSAAARASELAGQGFALVFATVPGAPSAGSAPPLRAAAGFE